MPFLTEEIWQHMSAWKGESEMIATANWPASAGFDPQIQKEFAQFEEVVTEIRTIRKKQNLPNKEALTVSYLKSANRLSAFDKAIQHLCNVSELNEVEEKMTPSFGFIVGGVEYFIPYSASVDMEAERAKMQEELVYLEGFLASVEKKLSNERFVQNAPEAVLESERKKQADAQSKIAAIKEQLGN
jgi:valyl-tRNA synthetase